MNTPTITTGRAARLCAVTPDTVLKWIKSGKLAATKTAGGHYRLDPLDISPFLAHTARERTANKKLPRVACWDFFAEHGKIRDACRVCTAYKAEAHNCFIIARFGRDAGHQGTVCANTCEECAYYRRLLNDTMKILVATPYKSLSTRLRRVDHLAGEVLTARDAYQAGVSITDHSPDVVVIDERLAGDGAARIAENLAQHRPPAMRLVVRAARSVTDMKPRKKVPADMIVPVSMILEEAEPFLLSVRDEIGRKAHSALRHTVAL